MKRDKFNIWWDLPDSELCSECGQPDNCGDCNHRQLSDENVGKLGGILSFWFMPRPDLGFDIFGLEKYSSYPEDNSMNIEARKSGYIFGEWFSIACKDGELGSNHASRCIQIPPLVFVRAREINWEVAVIRFNMNDLVRGYEKVVREIAKNN